MKVHLFYLRSEENRLYAYTTNDEYARQFIETRNKEAFYYKTEKMDELICKAFMNKHKTLQLITVPLADENDKYSIIATYEEDEKLMVAEEELGNQMDYFNYHFLKNVPFNDEYKELISQLTTYYHDENNHPVIDVDEVKLFYEIFKNTFSTTKINES